MREWSIVPTANIEGVWGAVERFIGLACEAGFEKYSPGDFLKTLLEEKAQLWLGISEGRIEAAAITDVIQFPNKKYARVTIGMGERPDDLESFITAFEAWAKSIGCDGVQSDMRPGFASQFAKQGWKKSHILMEKSLNA